ncbi:hypothetical protein [Methanobrevibacter arboriphilus]|uniref:Uncharacterized protein n=1 Tax=Methanobrevibacter arboriphilus TaxID=39441 RepID=A0ACA8R544_METAZ|nr:hypothetical protein [Methanobrevibacter arboriphilus]BBL62446.1 hypothetical protein MarbSA_14860 [Methanobrevibacter arboriphilus]
MADLSNKELLITYGNYQDMIRRTRAYRKGNGKNPTNVYLNSSKKDYISYKQLKDMYKRVKQYKKDKPKKVLNNVWIKKPKNTVNVLTPKYNNPTVNIKGKKYIPKNFTEFYNLMGGFGYSYYYNDIYTLSQEIKNLTIGKAMNCTDFAQLGVYIASQFKKDNKSIYQTRYRHVNCKSGSGHTQFEIKGGEFNKWTIVDISAKADKNSKVYPIGTGWCLNGTVRGYNESWVLSDDGKS